MKLLGKKILVKVSQKNPQKNANGIIVQEEEKNINSYYDGKVILMGDGVDIKIKVGDVIQYSFKQDFNYQGEKCHLTDQENVLCINN